MEKTYSDPKVTVVIPAYNAAETIGEAIDSVLQQSVQQFEIIVVDDASTDQTAEKVRTFADPRIRYHRLKSNHGGPSRARNTGVRLARAEYVALLDADDVYCSGRLERGKAFLDRHQKAAMVFTNEIRFDHHTAIEKGRFLDGYDVFWALPRYHEDELGWIIKAEDAYSALFFASYIMPSGVTLRRKVVKTLGGFDEDLKNGDDRDMWLRLTRQYAVGFIPMDGFRYRVGIDSISKRGAILACNRSAVIQKQLKQDLPPRLRKQGRKLVAYNAYGLGYDHQIRGEMEAARHRYMESLKWQISVRALKGVIISFLGRQGYAWLRKQVRGKGLE